MKNPTYSELVDVMAVREYQHYGIQLLTVQSSSVSYLVPMTSCLYRPVSAYGTSSISTSKQLPFNMMTKAWKVCGRLLSDT